MKISDLENSSFLTELIPEESNVVTGGLAIVYPVVQLAPPTLPPVIPPVFTYNKCELGVIDPVDCPENNPIPAPQG